MSRSAPPSAVVHRHPSGRRMRQGRRPTRRGSPVTPREKVYVAPGKYDEFYAFMSGGFGGQVGVYGLPSGRLLRQSRSSRRTPRTARATASRPSRC